MIKGQKELAVSNFLKSRTNSGIASGIDDTKAKILAQRSSFRGGLSSALGETASKYGLPSGTQDAGELSANRGLESADIKNTTTQGLRSLNEKRKVALDTANFLADRLEQSGMDRRNADLFARNFATMINMQEFSAGEASKGRTATIAGEDMKDTYAKVGAAESARAQDAARQDALTSQIYSSLFGLVGAGGTAAILNAKKKPVTAPSGWNTATNTQFSTLTPNTLGASDRSPIPWSGVQSPIPQDMSRYNDLTSY